MVLSVVRVRAALDWPGAAGASVPQADPARNPGCGLFALIHEAAFRGSNTTHSLYEHSLLLLAFWHSQTALSSLVSSRRASHTALPTIAALRRGPANPAPLGCSQHRLFRIGRSLLLPMAPMQVQVPGRRRYAACGYGEARQLASLASGFSKRVGDISAQAPQAPDGKPMSGLRPCFLLNTVVPRRSHDRRPLS